MAIRVGLCRSLYSSSWCTRHQIPPITPLPRDHRWTNTHLYFRPSPSETTTPAPVHPLPQIEREAIAPAAQNEEAITQNVAFRDTTIQRYTENDSRTHIPDSHEAEQVAIVLTEPRFYKAATVGDVNTFQEALLDPEGDGEERVANRVSPQKNSVLHVAASFGQLEVVKTIHQHCPSLVMKKNSRGDTALHNAARYGHSFVIKYLIHPTEHDNGDIETGSVKVENGLLRMTNVDGNTALHEATKNGHSEAARLLLNKDPELAKLVNNVGESPFYLAAEGGILELVKKFLGMPINHFIQENQEGKTALHAAVAEERKDIMNILLKEKPKLVESKDKRGRTALHYAAFSGYLHEVCRLLQSKPSNAHQRDNNGMSPIHLATINGHIKVMEAILEQCPDSRELLSNKAQNILHVAVASKKESMVRYILAKHELAKLINDRDKDGNTPLHLASIEGHATIVSIFVRDKRVDLTIKNNESKTAYEVAEENATSPFSFRKILAAAVLKSKRAPPRQCRLFFEENIQKNVSNEKNTLENFKDRVNTLVVVATLIMTITYQSGLTMPGGNNINNPANDKITNLLARITHHIFVISNTTAMYTSIISAITLIWAHLGDMDLLDFALKWSMLLLAISLTMMAVGFSAGLYLVVIQFRWLAILVLVMGFFFLVCILALFIPLQAPILPKQRWTHLISKFTIKFLLFATGHEPRGFFE